MKPCRDCPFTRACPPGKLGGSSALTFVGQVHGPFWLPCHSHTNYADPNWKTDISKPQCAGAAMFRANVGVAELMPDGLLAATPDASVFASAAEFLAHHAPVDGGELRQFTSPKSVERLVRWQMNKSAVKRMKS